VNKNETRSSKPAAFALILASGSCNSRTSNGIDGLSCVHNSVPPK